MDQEKQPALTTKERNILEFEQSWWLSDSPKDQAVRERFQLTEAEYSVALDALIDSEAALLEEPLLVRRLRRLRDRRRRAHFERRTADQEVVR